MIDDKASAAPRPEVINRVVAWHNRHPLARRITAAQVRHVGLVLLPFAAPGDGPALSMAPPATADAAASAPAPAPEAPRHTAKPSAADEDQAAAELMGELVSELPTDHAPEATAASDNTPSPPADPTIDLPLDEIIAASAPVAEAAASKSEQAAAMAAPDAPFPPIDEHPSAPHGEPGEAAAAPVHPPAPAAMPQVEAARKPWWRRWLRTAAKPNGPAPLFTEDLMPELGLKALVALALKHGLTQLPPGERWQWRSVALDEQLQDQSAAAGLSGRADRVLLTAALDDGTRRHRLLIGAGLKPHIEGPRLWDRQRVGALAGVGLICLSVAAWAVGRHAGIHAVLAQAPAASAPAASAASSAPLAASGAQAPSQPASQTQASASAASAAEPSASSATTSAHTPVPAVESPASASAPGPHDASASAPTPSDPAMAALTPAGTPPPSIAPNLRPQLARVAQAQSTQRFALVSAPIRSGAEAQALLRRLRAETARVHHPVAVETSIHQSAQGWRVSWWPFANQRQADNARAALADRQLEMEVVEF